MIPLTMKCYKSISGLKTFISFCKSFQTCKLVIESGIYKLNKVKGWKETYINLINSTCYKLWKIIIKYDYILQLLKYNIRRKECQQ